MVDRGMAPIFKTGQNKSQLEEARSWFIEDYAAQDLNHDGFLSLDELLREPLANFGCMDRNRDGELTQGEIDAGLTRCGSGRSHFSQF